MTVVWQVPSTHMPDAHCPFVAHAAPVGNPVHVPWTQLFETQSPFCWQAPPFPSPPPSQRPFTQDFEAQSKSVPQVAPWGNPLAHVPLMHAMLLHCTLLEQAAPGGRVVQTPLTQLFDAH